MVLSEVAKDLNLCTTICSLTGAFAYPSRKFIGRGFEFTRRSNNLLFVIIEHSTFDTSPSEVIKCCYYPIF